jgi:hypothetical protein
MNAFLLSVVAAVGVAVGSYFVVNAEWQKPAYEAYTTGGARVGYAGDNLVGKDWPGMYKLDQKSGS